MTQSHTAVFILFCLFLISVHACNCRILVPKDYDRGKKTLGLENVMENIGSKLQDSESVSSMKTLHAMTAKDPIVLQKYGRCPDTGSHHQSTKTGIPKIEERRLQDNYTLATQEIDANEPAENDVGQDAVVMDYAHPHRKPPIHN